MDPRVSVAELQRWPDDGHQYELYDGEVCRVPSPNVRHQRVALHLAEILHDYEQRTGGLVVIAPIDIKLSDYDLLQPDIVFFRSERRHVVNMQGNLQPAPDLAVEVLSPSTQTRDRRQKFDLFAKFGVPEYWIVDPVLNTVEVYRLDGTGFMLDGEYREPDEVRSATLPALRVSASRLFAE